MDKIAVYVAPCCDGEIKPLSIDFRNKEIENVKNAELKMQKYSAFKLLEVGLWDGFRMKIDEIGLKRAGAKLVSDKIKISLSHCDGFVAVALGSRSVGVDIERSDIPRKHAVNRVFTDEELQRYSALPDGEKHLFYIAGWTKKESVFKRSDENVFCPEKILTESQSVRTFTYPQRNLIISVATASENDNISFSWFEWSSGCFLRDLLPEPIDT